MRKQASGPSRIPIVLVLVSLATLAWAAPAEHAGQITALIPDGQRNSAPVKVQDAVEWNDLLKTLRAGRMRANLDDGSILTVGRESELRVVQHDAASQQTSLELNYGRMRSKVVPLTKSGAKFEVRTPHAVIGVIGTDFYILVTATRTLVICYSGVLSVTSLVAGVGAPGATPAQATHVNSGQMVEANSTGVGTPQPTPHDLEQQSMEETSISETPPALRKHDFSRFEVAGLFSFARVGGGGSAPKDNWAGGGGSFTVYFNRWIGITADVRGYTLPGLKSSQADSARALTYTFGPRFSLPTRGRVTPFFQTTVGKVRLTADCVSSCNLSPVENVFAMATGGGFDVSFGRRYAIRQQVEYFMTRFIGDGTAQETQNNVRMTTGIVVRFGK
jgi:hypothetical protein